MSDNEYWTDVIRTTGFVLITLIGGGLWSCQKAGDRLLEATKAGGDPIRYACAEMGDSLRCAAAGGVR